MDHVRDRVWSVMEAIRACMFITHDVVDGAPVMRARPMAALPDRAAGAVWFFTGRASAKPEELRDDRRTCLVFHQTEGGVFLSVSGYTDLSHDPALRHAKWDREAALWFDSPDNPDVLLLRFRPESVEYWTRPGDFDRVAREVKAARAEGRAADIGQNEKISF